MEQNKNWRAKKNIENLGVPWKRWKVQIGTEGPLAQKVHRGNIENKENLGEAWELWKAQMSTEGQWEHIEHWRAMKTFITYESNVNTGKPNWALKDHGNKRMTRKPSEQIEHWWTMGHWKTKKTLDDHENTWYA